MIALGRWDEALQIARAAEPISRGNGRIFVNIQLARILTPRGDIEAATRALDIASHKLARPNEAQFSGPLAWTRMELDLWRGDIAAARETADEVGPILDQTEDRMTLAWFLARAMRVEAEAAERARAARDETAVAEAVRRGDGWYAMLERIDVGTIPSGYRSGIHLAGQLGAGERSRISGASDPQMWSLAVAGADARPMAFESAYARFRLAEAMLAARGSRDEASAVLVEARSRAAALSARPLLDLIDGLAARARLSLGDITDGAEPVSAGPGNPVAAYELTARELEVLRLVVAGRTNRQIGEELFISESTAGVHVSRILAKFGVAGRVEAATIAARLGIAD
jgi:DNA-binding CsgD family transcriptional regulator